MENKVVIEKENTMSTENNKVCSKCGNELKEDMKFCNKCGNKIHIKTLNFINKKFIIVGLIISVLIIFLVLKFTIFGSVISNNKLTEILKFSDNGTYLQENTVSCGPSINIEYNNYDKLLSYSAIYKNGSVTLNAGGLMLYNSKTQENKIIRLDSTTTAIIYYLNTNNGNSKLKNFLEITGEYIKENNIEEINITSNGVRKYMNYGKEIGKSIGVKLCREISTKTLKGMATELQNNSSFFYEKDEIFPRYVGSTTTNQVYCWKMMDETTANYVYLYNKTFYNQLVYQYGQPYKTVTQFSVYDFTKDDTPLVKSFESKEKAILELEVEE